MLTNGDSIGAEWLGMGKPCKALTEFWSTVKYEERKDKQQALDVTSGVWRRELSARFSQLLCRWTAKAKSFKS
jgi:hypothetical protein